ncbi:MAG TPA: T9SS type A sorting domain-containing protein [Adhaeribacter sp.]|nr:T9SS type A sorting domain-containing protein [Adhaeribacter sp.]
MKTIFTFLLLFLLSAVTGFAQTNNFPSGTMTVNNVPKNDTDVIEIFPGDSLKIVINSSDPDPLDSVKVTSDFALILPGATITKNNALKQTAYLTWVPTAADIRLRPYYIGAAVKDNGQPISIRIIWSFEIRVNPAGSITLNNYPVNINQEIVLRPGDPFNFRLSSVTPTYPDSLKIISNVKTVIPAATFTTDNAMQQTADISWTPAVADVRVAPYQFNVTIQDSRKPTGALYHYSIKIRVTNTLAVKDDLSQPVFTAYPNPFTDNLTFRFEQSAQAKSLIIYNLLGQQIDQISVNQLSAGSQEISWQNAGKYPAGTYVAKLISGNDKVQTLKFTKVQ